MWLNRNRRGAAAAGCAVIARPARRRLARGKTYGPTDATLAACIETFAFSEPPRVLAAWGGTMSDWPHNAVSARHMATLWQ